MEYYYSVFLPRKDSTFKWLEDHCESWNTEDDVNDLDMVLVSFDTLSEANTAKSCLFYGSKLIN